MRRILMCVVLCLMLAAAIVSVSAEEVCTDHSFQGGKCTLCGIELVDEGQCGDEAFWYLTTAGELILEGRGTTWDFIGYDTEIVTVRYHEPENDPAPWKDYYQQITAIQISPEITYLGENIFWSLYQVQELRVPEGVEALGYSALDYCEGMKMLYLPSTMNTITGILHLKYLETICFEGSPPDPASPNLLLDTFGIRQILYRSSREGWDDAMENWYTPAGTQWIDMDGAINPAELAFSKGEYTIRPGESIRLTTNADPYTGWLLTRWETDAEGVVLISDETVTGLKPGTVTITAASEDGTYRASCVIHVTESEIPESGRVLMEGSYGANAGYNDYSIWGNVADSYLNQAGDGTLELVQYDWRTEVLSLYRYDGAGNLLSQETLPMELPIFGGFYAGEDSYFLLYGQLNDEEDDGAEVLRLVRYTKDWQRMDHGSVFGCDITTPFSAGNTSFAEANGVLYLHTCHTAYTSSDGLRHQSSVTFAVDLKTMTLTTMDAVFTSHSFAQRVRAAETGIFFADHGDGAPRAVKIKRIRDLHQEGTALSVLKIQGRPGDNYTGVSLGGFELSTRNCLVAGNSVDQSTLESFETASHRNIFLSVAGQDLSSSRFLWLTELTGEETRYVSTPQLVKVAEDLFLALWEIYETDDNYLSKYLYTQVLLLDGEGNRLSQTVDINGRLSDCQPIVTDDGRVTWFAAKGTQGYLYRLNWYQLMTDPEGLALALGHQYEATVTEPTCTQGGYTTYTCECGDRYVADETAPLGHDWDDGKVITHPTGTEEGLLRRTCIRCGMTMDEAIPATGEEDEYQEIRESEPNNDLEQANWVYHGYQVFGGVTTTDLTDCYRFTLDRESTVSIRATGESRTLLYGIMDSSGREVLTRSTSLGTSDEGGFLFDLEITLAVGEYYIVVVDIADYYNDYSFTTQFLPVDGSHVHSYKAVVTAPNCTEGGFTTYTCDCGDSYTSDETAALGHDYVNSFCDRCGQIENPFTDVPEGQWFFEPVLWAVENKITSGISATTFAPNATCTRAQVVTFLWRAMGQPEPASNENPFSDVMETDYFYKAVLWAVENGITSGTGGGKFSPNNPCTRDQVVTFLWRTMGKPTPEKTENPFTDVAEGIYYYQPVLWAVENGITSGTSATTFAPTNPCTRAQVVTFLYRTLKDK